MQFSSRLATAYLLLLSPAAAFYPYIPKGWGELSSLKTPYTSTRRNALPSRTKSDSFITLPLRRHPKSQLRQRDNNYNIVSAAKPSQTNSVAIDQDTTDFTYMSMMSFGTSQKEYHMLLDTAAANTWVMSSACTTTICNNHNTFGPSESSSIQESTDTFSITYGTGNVNGSVVTDDAHFAGLTAPLTFGLASGVSQEFNSYALDGIVGLGRVDTNAEGINSASIIDVLHQRSLIPARLFGVHLGRHATPPIDGELNLGAPNPNRYDGELNYIDVVDNERGFWEIPIEDSGVDGTSSGLTDRFAIIDTGTSFVLLPPDDAEKIHSLIPGSALNGDTYTVPCDASAVVQFSFGGRAYNISNLDYVGDGNGAGACNSQIIARQTFGEKQWLVGDVFLKNVYTVFDYEQSRIGFGVKGGNDADQGQDDQPDGGDSGSTATSTAATGTAPTSTSETNPSSVADSQNASTTTSAAAPSHHQNGMLALGLAVVALVAL